MKRKDRSKREQLSGDPIWKTEKKNRKFILKIKSYMKITFSRDFTSVAILNL